MRNVYLVFALLAAPAGLVPTCFAAASAERGAEVLHRENCLLCHSLRGEGGGAAPDLSRRVAQNYTPAALASLVWNHAPSMWAEIAEKKLPMPRLTQGDSEDLFAYLYSTRFFDHPGDAGRGKQIFTDKHCAECHSLNAPAKGPGNPVSTWKSLSDPLMLVERMWNHSGAMRKELTKRQLEVTLTGSELSDLTVYLQNFGPKSTAAASTFNIPDAASGKPLYDAECAQCHKGSLALSRQPAGRTLTDLAAGMWNHLPHMLTLPMVGPDDMSKIVAYVWEQQYLGPAGTASRGKKVFEEKHCASCHDDAGFSAAHFVRGSTVFTPLTMVTVVWSHGPQMQEQMKQRGIGWPRLSPEEVGNLVAYLNTRP